jgi:hypothetical protein
MKCKTRTLAIGTVVLLAVTTLTACEGIPASPTPRAVNGVTILDNPVYMNDNNLAILRFYWGATHNPAIAAQADSLLDTTANASMPDNVIMARAAWFQGEPSNLQNVECIAGELVTGGLVVASAADPPATLVGVFAAWIGGISGTLTTLQDCWDTFQWSEPDFGQRWLLDCEGAYLADNDYNMLNPAWQPSDMIKFQKCVVFGWAASRAIANGAREIGQNDLVTLRGNYVCNITVFPIGTECHWE